MSRQPYRDPDSSLSAARTAPQVESDPAAESLTNALRAGFNVLRVIMIVLLGLYLMTGWFKVDPGQQGLVVRLGKLRVNREDGSSYAGTPVFDQGSYWALPDPFDEKIRLSGKAHALPVTTFLFSHDQEDSTKPLVEILPVRSGLEPGVDGAMLTGDGNLAHGRWTVEYRIADGDRFVKTVGEDTTALEPLLRRLAETAILRTVASRPVRDVLSDDIREISAAVKSRLQRELARLEAGVQINTVIAETIEPGSVRAAFLAVTDAENERQRLIEAAEQRRKQILNQAAGPNHGRLLELIAAYGGRQAAGADQRELAALRATIDAELERSGGQVAVLLREARATANQITEKIRREHEEFAYYLEQYRKTPRATALLLWTRMRTAVLGSKQNELFYLPRDADIIEIITNRDVSKRLEKEIEDYRKRFESSE